MEGSSVVEQSRDHLFGQVYNRKEKNVMEVVDVTNPNLARTPDDPSPMNEDLSIALRKGTRYGYGCGYGYRYWYGYGPFSKNVDGMSAASQLMVGSIPDHPFSGSSVQAARCCFTCWSTIAGFAVSCTAPPSSPFPAPPPAVSFPLPLLRSSAAADCDFSAAVAVFTAAAGCDLSATVGCDSSAAVIPKIDDALDTGNNTKSENLPVHVTSIRLNKDNYLSWSAALEIGITSRGRLHYITGEKPAPSKTDPQWATWALEDSQVKVWIISSVSADIQPLILRKSTTYDMWTVLARMYGHHALYWEKEWMDRTFIFLGGLRDEFESIQSQILNCDEIPGIEEGQGSVLLDGAAIATKWVILLIFVGIFILRSVSSGVVLLLIGVLLLCPSLVKKIEIGSAIDGLYRMPIQVASALISATSGQLSGVEDRFAIMRWHERLVSEDIDSQMEGGPVEEQSRDHLFGQVYNRKKKDVMEDVDVTNPNLPNLVSSPDDPIACARAPGSFSFFLFFFAATWYQSYGRDWRREAHSRRADVMHTVGDPPSPFRLDLFHFLCFFLLYLLPVLVAVFQQLNSVEEFIHARRDA
ncbi:hypothetical protein EJ110_NYTH58591 [Nymphaea thermarum]|nr:hypothetical protein EJ110_NYTH58591 [Nymphaea thermarum]